MSRSSPQTGSRTRDGLLPGDGGAVTDAFGMYCGDLKVGFKNADSVLPAEARLPYVLPMPKNVPTAKELKLRAPGEWGAERARYVRRSRTFANNARARTGRCI